MNLISSFKKYLLPGSGYCMKKSNVAKFAFLLIAAATALQSNSQVDKRIAQADKYFSSGEYYTAALLYGQFLNTNRKQQMPAGFPLGSKRNRQGYSGRISQDEILYKQAESYRLANYWKEASVLYKQYFEKDSADHAEGLYWYAVCQRSLGNYNLADESLKNFISNYAAVNSLKEEAEKEKETILFVKTQLSRPDSVLYHIQKIALPDGAEKGIFGVSSIPGNQFIITSTKKDSLIGPGVNPFHNRLFSTAISDGNWQNPELISIDSLDASLNQGSTSISADGKYLYLTQWNKEKGTAIYYATKQSNGWSKPVLLPVINQQGYNSKQPFCTTDGKYIFFASDMPGGSGKYDIWYAPLLEDGTAGVATNAGSVVNTADDEQAPFYQGSGSTLIFSSNRRAGMGGYDLFSTIGFEQDWNEPENLGHPVNSSRDDVYFFAPENKPLLANAFFSSDRGSDCCFETYTVTKDAKKKFITGVIFDCNKNEPLADADVILKDVTGKIQTVKTGVDGKYEFELTGEENQQQLSISKKLYKDKLNDVAIKSTDESGWLIDILSAETICLEKKLVIKPENVVTVFFDFDKSILKDRATEVLDSIYNVLMEDTTATIQISGYTDGLGTVDYNKRLSDRRATTCATYLMEKGINNSRITFESFGACCPIEMEIINGRDNAEGRSKNRRALINISKTEPVE
jgi:outer membrane protein OmpA-like peptidoglycan-associated protein